MLDRLKSDIDTRRAFDVSEDYVEASLDREEIHRALNEHESVLVKWQARQREWVAEFHAMRQTDSHVVLHLHRPLPEHIADFLTKYPESSESVFHRHNHQNKLYCEAYRQISGLQYRDVVILDEFTRYESI